MGIRESDHIRPRRGKPAIWTSANARRRFAVEILGEMALVSTKFEPLESLQASLTAGFPAVQGLQEQESKGGHFEEARPLRSLLARSKAASKEQDG
jgi:hypothetical protein